MSIKLTRRNLLALATTSVALSFIAKRKFFDTFGERTFQGEVKGANFIRGHRLLLKNFPSPSKTIERNVSIVGSGVSGLSCAYHLTKKGIHDIELFELEDHLGGKSATHKDKAPWGAHYLPLVNKENESLIEFLKDIEVIEYVDSNGTPKYNDLMICSDPMEKLYIYGRYQEGILPKQDLKEKDKKDFAFFFQKIEKLSQEKGSDNKYAFDIPMEKSSQDQKYLDLDKITMKAFLLKYNLTSKPLHWYVNYCCRDDFGTNYKDISAWAGIHYFASRRGTGKDIHEESIMTWPQGNGFLIQKLKERSNLKISNGLMLFDIKGNDLHFYDFNKDQTTIVRSKQIVLALPQFIINKVLNTQTHFEYSPWMVANIEIDWDREIESSLAWDNVSYHGKGIGFVVSNHQSLRTKYNRNYLTYYWPLTHLSPKEARKFALKRTHEQWCQDILADLSPMIHDFEQRVRSINIWPWGHGMVSPRPGFLFKERLNAFKNQSDFLHFAHTDLSGLSLFEEGYFRGEEAANRVAKSLKGKV